MTTEAILKAMRADGVPAGKSGFWTVRKVNITEESNRLFPADALHANAGKLPPPGRYTYLLRWTNDTLFKSHGELVMNDFPGELKKHLEFVMKARGRVLVTGLGLGCVVRGLLARGLVDSIDLVERDTDVIELCGASVADPRVKIHVADARKELPPGRFDYAWHDLWSDPDRDEPHLQVTHFKLMRKLMDRVGLQGAWAMPRKLTRRIPEFRLSREER
jgi:hypothetical protein